jgi:hypothetical protein
MSKFDDFIHDMAMLGVVIGGMGLISVVAYSNTSPYLRVGAALFLLCLGVVYYYDVIKKNKSDS